MASINVWVAGGGGDVRRLTTTVMTGAATMRKIPVAGPEIP